MAKYFMWVPLHSISCSEFLWARTLVWGIILLSCDACKGRGWPRQAIGSMVKNYKEEGFSYKHYRSNEWIYLTNMVILFVLQILQGNCPPPWKSCVWCSICIHILWECHEASRLCVGNKLTRDRIILLHLSLLYQKLSFIKIM